MSAGHVMAEWRAGVGFADRGVRGDWAVRGGREYDDGAEGLLVVRDYKSVVFVPAGKLDNSWKW